MRFAPSSVRRPALFSAARYLYPAVEPRLEAPSERLAAVGVEGIYHAVRRLFVLYAAELAAEEGRRRDGVDRFVVEWLPSARAFDRHVSDAASGARHAAESGVWLSAADGGSVHLVDEVTGLPVTYPDGAPVAFSLKELAAIAADRQRTTTEGIAGLYNRLFGEGADGLVR